MITWQTGGVYTVSCSLVLTFSLSLAPPPPSSLRGKKAQILSLWLAGCQATRTVSEAAVT